VHLQVAGAFIDEQHAEATMKDHNDKNPEDDRSLDWLGKTYDEFFASKSRVGGIQFWGLILLGTSLATGAISVVVFTLVKLSRFRSPGPAEAIMLLIVLAICVPIAVFGAAYIRRALAGRH
jgi:hypothetical protein